MMMNEGRNIGKEIEKLSGSHAKSLLKLLMLRLQAIVESNDAPDKKEEALRELYHEWTSFSRPKRKQKRNVDIVHMVAGESAAGSIRVGLGHSHLVIGFPDYFSMGPVFDLHTEKGLERRYEWLKDHILYSDDYIEEEYEGRFRDALDEIKSIPEDLPIILWTAENADEQAGVRFFLHLLQDRTNDIYLINTTLAFQELYDRDDIQYFFHHTGEVHPDKLKEIFEKKRRILTDEEKEQYQKEWLELAKTQEVLRTWDRGKIKGIPEDDYDHHLITAVRRLQDRRGEDEFIKAGRIIGEVYGHLGGVSDVFLEYRLRTLIYEGVLEIKGIPKGMRYYSVRMKS